MSISALIGCVVYEYDLTRKMVDEDRRQTRAYLAGRCYTTFFLFFCCLVAVYILVRVQREIDPPGEGKGLKCWAFMLLSNMAALLLLLAMAWFVKFG
jgi:hypothetical protein